MKKVLIITKKELIEYFSTPIAYVIIGVFALIVGVYFGNFVFVENQASLRKLFEFIPVLLIVFIPALTMKSFADELKSGTFEVLVTLPVTNMQIIFGKFLSNLAMVCLMLITTLPSLFTIVRLGNPDIGQTVLAYFGLLILSSAYILLGLVISINTKNQIIAFILSAFVMAILYFIGEAEVLRYIPSTLVSVFEFLGLGVHFRSIAKGVIDSRDIIYYLSIMIISFVLILISFKRIQKQGR